MQVDSNWIAFFSQSGSELNNIIYHTGRVPAAIITNRQNDDGINASLKLAKDEGKLNWITLPKNPELKDYKKALKSFKDPLITLHGYLRIIPKEICKKYKNIYNLHPGLITEYPDLKGKDPQVRAVKAGYNTAGAVIHKVIPAVDEGEIILSHSINIGGLNEEEVIEHLHSLGSVLWYQFFKNYEHRRNSKNDRRSISSDLY
jgi:folate-dependent phosphoribosylglycinamide formyltransferase PurN